MAAPTPRPAPFPPMNARQARQLLLVRAHESVAPASPIWQAADQAWAGEEALRRHGEAASGPAWLIGRAELAAQRLAERDPAVAAALRPTRRAGWWIAALVLLALLAGLASDAAGPARQINLLAPPLLLVLVWNLFVYAALGLGALAARIRPAPSTPSTPALPHRGPWRRLLERWAHRTRPAARGPASPALRRYTADWAEAVSGLQACRLVTALHLAAAAVAAGALAALYLRGLVFEYRAGWDSTFLGADAVHAWLAALLGPASTLSGLPLPDPARLDELRFSRGPGENASVWIHLYALTTAGLVLLPRMLLAGIAAWRGREIAHRFALPNDDPWSRRLLQWHALARGDAPLAVWLLPYSVSLPAASLPALTNALEVELGARLVVRDLPTMPLGGEDEFDAHWPAIGGNGPVPAVVAPVLALGATPERETHGAFLARVKARCASLPLPPRCLVLLDESGFRQRLRGADLATRLAQRHAAWKIVLDEVGLSAVAIDLGARDGAAGANPAAGFAAP